MNESLDYYYCWCFYYYCYLVQFVRWMSFYSLIYFHSLSLSSSVFPPLIYNYVNCFIYILVFLLFVGLVVIVSLLFSFSLSPPLTLSLFLFFILRFIHLQVMLFFYYHYYYYMTILLLLYSMLQQYSVCVRYISICLCVFNWKP